MYQDQELPVQLNKPYAYVPGPYGRVEALITWTTVEDELFAHVYALIPQGVPAKIPLPGQKGANEYIKMLLDAKSLELLPAEALSEQQVFRIYCRDVGWMVIVSLADKESSGINLAPGGIYGYFPNGREDPHRIGMWPQNITRDLLRTWDVMRPVLRVRNAEDAKKVGKTNADLIIWDLGEIYRSGQRARMARTY
jgi:hypothetical protein